MNKNEQPIPLTSLRDTLRKSTGEADPTRIIIQKDGRLAKLSWGLLQSCVEAAGGKMPSRKESDRSDIQTIKGPVNAKIILTRSADIPGFVERGLYTYGIVGEDQVAEQQRNVSVDEKLNLGKCSLKTMVRNGSPARVLPDLNRKSIATPYPSLTKRLFEKFGVFPSEIERVKSTEAAVAAGDFDAGIDIVETGTTMQANGLRPIANMGDFGAVLIRSRCNNLKWQGK